MAAAVCFWWVPSLGEQRQAEVKRTWMWGSATGSHCSGGKRIKKMLGFRSEDKWKESELLLRGCSFVETALSITRTLISHQAAAIRKQKKPVFELTMWKTKVSEFNVNLRFFYSYLLAVSISFSTSEVETRCKSCLIHHFYSCRRKLILSMAAPWLSSSQLCGSGPIIICTYGLEKEILDSAVFRGHLESKRQNFKLTKGLSASFISP